MYGLAAMYQLMQSDKNKPVQIRQIAKSANVPQNYLEQILVLLKRNALIKSVRGANGGYMLQKSPQEITIYEILDILEDGLCSTSIDTKNEVLDLFWKDKQKKILEIFDIPLAELDKFEQQYKKHMMYVI